VVEINLGTLTAHINADTSGLDKGMRNAERRMKSASRTIKRAAKVATTALAGIGAATSYMVQAASASQELNNVVNQSFGDSADAINDWADETAGAMNRSIYQMRQFSAMNQAILKPLLGTNKQTEQMSKNLTTLAVDLGSFFNVADEQAFDAIQSGLMGMVKPLRTFGIDLTQATLQAYALEKGIDANVEKMSQARKVQLRYNYLMDNTNHIQGDAIRTGHTLENQLKRLSGEWRNLRGALGKQFLPEATKVVTKTADIVENLSNLDEGVLNNIKNFTLFTSKVLAVVAGLGLFTFAVETVIKSLAILGTIFGVITSPIVLGTLAIAAASYMLYTAWTENWGGIRDKTETIWNNHLKPIYDKMLEWMGEAWDWIIETSGDAWDWMKNTTWREKWEDIKQWMEAGWNWIIDIAGDGWEWLEGKAPGLTGAVETGWFFTVDLVNDAAKWIREDAYDWFNNIVKTTWEFTVKGLDSIFDIWNWMNRNVGQNKFGIGDNAQSGQNTVQNPLNWLYESLIDPNGGRDSIIGHGFKTGGLTGDIGKDKVAGVVHGGEWVMPSWMVNKFPQLTRMLEGMRTKGYQDGGSVMTSLSSGSGGFSFQGISTWIKDLSDNMSSITEILGKGFSALLDVLVDVLNVIGNILPFEGTDNLGDKVKDSINNFKDIIDKIFGKPESSNDNTGGSGKHVPLPGKTEDAWTKLMGKIGVAWIDLKEKVKGMWSKSLSAFSNAKEWLQKPWNDKLSDMKNMFAKTVTGIDWKKIGSNLKAVTGSILQGAGGAGGGLSEMLSGNFAGGIMSMVQNSGTFAKVMEDIGPVLAEIANIIGEVFAPVLRVLKPLLEAVAKVFRFVGIVILTIAKGILDAWNFVAQGIELLINGIIKMLNKIPFVDIDYVSLTVSTDTLEQSLDDLKNGTEETTESMEEMNKELQNVPDIFKIARRSMEAAIGINIPSAAVGGTVLGSGIAEVHRGEIIANEEQQGALTGNSVHVHFDGSVYGMNDFNQKVDEAVQKANKKRNKSKYGISRG